MKDRNIDTTYQMTDIEPSKISFRDDLSVVARTIIANLEYVDFVDVSKHNSEPPQITVVYYYRDNFNED